MHEFVRPVFPQTTLRRQSPLMPFNNGISQLSLISSLATKPGKSWHWKIPDFREAGKLLQ